MERTKNLQTFASFSCFDWSHFFFLPFSAELFSMQLIPFPVVSSAILQALSISTKVTKGQRIFFRNKNRVYHVFMPRKLRLDLLKGRDRRFFKTKWLFVRGIHWIKWTTWLFREVKFWTKCVTLVCVIFTSIYKVHQVFVIVFGTVNYKAHSYFTLLKHSFVSLLFYFSK